MICVKCSILNTFLLLFIYQSCQG